jgi:hypothetical protein
MLRYINAAMCGRGIAARVFQPSLSFYYFLKRNAPRSSNACASQQF